MIKKKINPCWEEFPRKSCGEGISEQGIKKGFAAAWVGFALLW